MESLIGQLPYAGWIVAIVVIILGVAAGLYMLDGYKSKKKDQENKGEDRLITLLQTTVQELEKKVNKQTTDIEALTKKVGDLERDNGLLVKVLQGRDDQTQAFYKQAFEAMKVAQQTHDVVTTLAESMKITNDNTTKLIELLSKHVDVMDHVATKRS